MCIIYRHHRPNPAILHPPPTHTTDPPPTMDYYYCIYTSLKPLFYDHKPCSRRTSSGYNTCFRIFFSRGFSITKIIITTIAQAPGNNINNNY